MPRTERSVSTAVFNAALRRLKTNEPLTVKQKAALKAAGLRVPAKSAAAKRTRRPCGAQTGGSRVQSLAFNKRIHRREDPRWSPELAATWAKNHNFTAHKVEETKSEFRIRQINPEDCAYRSVPFGKGTGVRAIMEFPRKKDTATNNSMPKPKKHVIQAVTSQLVDPHRKNTP